MAKTEDKVMALVEEELRKNPDAPTKELFEKAKKADKSVGDLSIQQFHARYPLQVKRRLGPGRPRKRRRQQKEHTPAGAAPDRAAIRGVFVQFARDLTAAEGTANIVAVVGNVDKYVDRVIKAAKAG